MQHTARSAEFMEKEGRAKVISTCKLLELDGIEILGIPESVDSQYKHKL